MAGRRGFKGKRTDIKECSDGTRVETFSILKRTCVKHSINLGFSVLPVSEALRLDVRSANCCFVGWMGAEHEGCEIILALKKQFKTAQSHQLEAAYALKNIFPTENDLSFQNNNTSHVLFNQYCATFILQQ